MKKISLLLVLSLVIFNLSHAGGREIPAYFKAGSFQGSIGEAQAAVQAALTGAGFDILGQYSPEQNPRLAVLVFTHKEIKAVCAQIPDRGYLAAPLKVGFVEEQGAVEVSFVNPEYLFNAYFGEKFAEYETKLINIDREIKKTLNIFGSDFTAFGGAIEQDDLQEYQYMWGMEEFTDPVKLATFSSFDEGLRIIRNNLHVGKGETISVYELVDPEKQVAVFGIGLLNKKDGEAFFLPVIGEKHVAAMPYEIILQGTEATMLHGRYRIALHWPELTMGTFTKIISTPGYIGDTFKALCK